jgi:hypothetical protein
MYVGDWRFNCATDVVANIQERVLVLEEKRDVDPVSSQQ